MKPVLCAVTDRGRWGGGCDDVVAQVARLARLGVHLVQVRERDLDGAALVALVQRCVEAVRGTGTRVLVNDRVDVAIAAGAHGVHLRGDSMPAYRVRDLVGRGAVVGRSVHALDEGMAVAAAGIYMAYKMYIAKPELPEKVIEKNISVSSFMNSRLPRITDIGMPLAIPLPKQARSGTIP